MKLTLVKTEATMYKIKVRRIRAGTHLGKCLRDIEVKILKIDEQKQG
jgi:hypothetical protein